MNFESPQSIPCCYTSCIQKKALGVRLDIFNPSVRVSLGLSILARITHDSQFDSVSTRNGDEGAIYMYNSTIEKYGSGIAKHHGMFVFGAIAK